MKKAIYLKTNRTEDFAYQNMERWLEIASLMDADCYILCDKEDIINQLEGKFLLLEGVQFIRSIKSEELKAIVDNIAVESWHNAAYAHLTTFVHAGQTGYDAFWNIDADDTQFCLSAERTLEALEKTEQYAIQEGIDCFSLDMWRTKTFLIIGHSG